MANNCTSKAALKAVSGTIQIKVHLRYYSYNPLTRQRTKRCSALPCPWKIQTRQTKRRLLCVQPNQKMGCFWSSRQCTHTLSTNFSTSHQTQTPEGAAIVRFKQHLATLSPGEHIIRFELCFRLVPGSGNNG